MGNSHLPICKEMWRFILRIGVQAPELFCLSILLASVQTNREQLNQVSPHEYACHFETLPNPHFICTTARCSILTYSHTQAAHFHARTLVIFGVQESVAKWYKNYCSEKVLILYHWQQNELQFLSFYFTPMPSGYRCNGLGMDAPWQRPKNYHTGQSRKHFLSDSVCGHRSFLVCVMNRSTNQQESATCQWGADGSKNKVYRPVAEQEAPNDVPF